MRGRKALGARLVARAWADAAFRARLLADAAAAAEELGIAASNFPPAPGAPRMPLTLTLLPTALGAPRPRRPRRSAPPPARRLAGASGDCPPARGARRPPRAGRAAPGESSRRTRSPGPAFGSLPTPVLPSAACPLTSRRAAAAAAGYHVSTRIAGLPTCRNGCFGGVGKAVRQPPRRTARPQDIGSAGEAAGAAPAAAGARTAPALSGTRLTALENTEDVHNVVVCTLCRCAM